MLSRSLAAVFVGATALAVAPAPASASVACGTVLTESITLTADLVCTEPGAPALVVGADRITVDLGGHEIRSSGTGVDNPGFDRVTVRGGALMTEGPAVAIRDGADRATVRGISASSAASPAVVVIADSRHSHVVANGPLSSVNGSGIQLLRSRHTVVRDNDVLANVTDGITLVDSSHNLVSGNTSRSNFGSGIAVTGGARNAIVSNVISNNDDSGIAVHSGVATILSRNEVFHNWRGVFVGLDAVRSVLHANDVADSIGGDGIHVEAPRTVLRANGSDDNVGWGIWAVDGAIDAGGNRASGNGAGECLNVECGP